MKLVIVESPAKAKTINKYLGKDFKVIASFGHIRDLPSKNGSVVPEQDFAMQYVINEKSRKYVDAIAKDAREAEAIYLATDPDREGEAISWHIAEVLREKKIVKSVGIFKRIAFNEITKKAVTESMKAPREIDINLVNAQQARRALDYLVGFTLSPILWRKLPGCKSAGRVQSVALRMICERQEERERFKIEEYWDILLEALNSKKEAFTARLIVANGEKLEKFSIVNADTANRLAEIIKTQQFSVTGIEKKQQKRNPPPPFITSSLQQEAARKLGFSAKKTMQVAQKLYEGINIEGENIGLITYMRTDGVTLSMEAVDAIRAFIQKTFGNNYQPAKARVYKSKVKNAQEAHEAIRPTDITLTPEKLKDKLEKDYHRLYELIWKRTVACQMENVVIDIVVALFDSDDKKFSAKATGSTIAFDGFYKIYREGEDDKNEEESNILPHFTEGEKIDVTNIIPQQHFTEPPPQYSEASLVKKLEERGIGRPSTYASILSVLQERKYVNLLNKRFVPAELGRLLNIFLVGFFKKYVEYDFTAELETELDEIAEGTLEWKTLLSNFWKGFDNNISIVREQKITDIISYLEQEMQTHLFGSNEDSARNCPSCAGGKLGLKLGKFGAFLACSNYPDCSFKKQITSGNDTSEEDNINASTQMDSNKLIGYEPQSGEGIYLKKGPYGWYLQLGEQISKAAKPKRAPLPSGIAPSNVTVDIGSKLLNLPLKIGVHPGTRQEITLGIGKFGPYLKYDGKFVSVPKTIDPFSVNLEQAVEIITSAANKVTATGKSKKK